MLTAYGLIEKALFYFLSSVLSETSIITIAASIMYSIQNPIFEVRSSSVVDNCHLNISFIPSSFHMHFVLQQRRRKTRPSVSTSVRGKCHPVSRLSYRTIFSRTVYLEVLQLPTTHVL